MIKRLSHYKSTILGIVLGIALFCLIWFEKLPDNWFTELSILIPVLAGLFYKPTTKDKWTHGRPKPPKK